MVGHGFNSIRIDTVPPKYLLDSALKYGLKIMVGHLWEQHITFLNEMRRKKNVICRVKGSVLSCVQHPAILCTLGNEIPDQIVRWYAKKK
jgi:hypothetical protein